MLKNALLQCDLRRVKTISRYLILAFVFGLLLSYQGAFAAIVAQQTNGSAIEAAQGSGNRTQTLGTGLSGNVSQFKIKVKLFTSSISNLGFNIERNGSYVFVSANGAFPTHGSWDGTAGDGIYTMAGTTPCNTNFCQGTLADIVFDVAGTYQFTIYISGDNSSWYGSSDPNAYPNGSITFCQNYSCSPLVDLYFIIGEAPTNEIEITFPPTATSTPDFGNFLLNWYAIDPTNTYVMINYGATSTNWAFTDQSGAGTENENTNVVFPKMNFLSQGNYYARANLFEYDVNYNKIYLATSTLINFNIIAGTYIEFFYPSPTSTATSSEWVFTCDPESGFFANSLCNLAQFLFVPKSDDFNKFTQLKTALESKPPMGYFYLIKNALLTFDDEAEAAFNLPQSSALNDYIFNPIKTGISFILWLIFGFWVFHRIRNLDL